MKLLGMLAALLILATIVAVALYGPCCMMPGVIKSDGPTIGREFEW